MSTEIRNIRLSYWLINSKSSPLPRQAVTLVFHRWPWTLGCYVIKLVAKFEQNQTTRRWVTAYLENFRRLILRGPNTPTFRGAHRPSSIKLGKDIWVIIDAHQIRAPNSPSTRFASWCSIPGHNCQQATVCLAGMVEVRFSRWPKPFGGISTAVSKLRRSPVCPALLMTVSSPK